MKRRILTFILVAAMMASALPAAHAADGFVKARAWTENSFRDVSPDEGYFETVKAAYEFLLMNGDPDGMFRPESKVTLAEVIAVASRIHAIASGQEIVFEQSADSWYQSYAVYALANGILSAEMTDYTRSATRLEVAQIMAKALSAEALAPINDVEYGWIPDVQDNEWVYLLYRAGVLSGKDELGTFQPDSDIARCEVADIAVKLVQPEQRTTINLTAPEGAGDHSDSDAGEVQVPVETDSKPPFEIDSEGFITIVIKP